MTARQRLQEVCDEINEIQVLLVDVVSSINSIYIKLGLRTRAELRYVSLANHTPKMEKKQENDHPGDPEG